MRHDQRFQPRRRTGWLKLTWLLPIAGLVTGTVAPEDLAHAVSSTATTVFRLLNGLVSILGGLII
jgi:hypothetical protein